MTRNTVETTCTGMNSGEPPDDCSMVIFGASGDLTHTRLLPALYALHRLALLPKHFAIIGTARRKWDDAQFREQMRAAIGESQHLDERSWGAFASTLHYVSGDATAASEESYARLRDKIDAVRTTAHIPPNVVFHLATAPDFYAEIVEKLAAAGLLDNHDGWRRVIIEKPFGRDEASARELDQRILRVIDESQLYRVDHYLGKETVQNMLVFRFANPGFEPIWNRNYIDHVQITVAEDGGIDARAGYYERAGVVRDMLQNHLLQLLCMTAIEPPVAYDGRGLRNETVKVLQAIRPIDARAAVLGQYGAGSIEYPPLPAYREERDVAPDSTTPTFVALALHIDNWRWSGVPFYVRTGKRLPQKTAAIIIRFKPTPHLMFPLEGDETPALLQHNVLTFHLQPDEGITHSFLAKQPGPKICLQPVKMQFEYGAAFGIEEPPSAYQWLLFDAMHGDQTLFPRSDWIYAAWAIVDPLLRESERRGRDTFPNYAAGSWGPAAADDLLRRDGREWVVP